MMQLGKILEFRKDLYFEGAVQADWFYNAEKSSKVAENFVFHGKKYFGIDESEVGNKKRIDTISLVEELALKFNEEGANPFSLAIADYGTGKSHLAVTIAQIFSGPEYMPKTYNKVLSNIKTIDSESASRIESLCDGRNFVMVINGMRDFNLHYEILKAAQKSLRLYGLPDDGLKKINRALDTAEMFFTRNSENSIALFESAAKKRGWRESGKNLIIRINNEILNNDDAFMIVNEVYTEINGQAIRWDEGISAAAILEMLMTEYCGMNGRFDHIVVLFDEFGRYLEYASGLDAAKSGDSALQQMFETAQNAEGMLQIINFIQSDIKTYLQRVDQTKNISRYIGRYDASDKYYISSNLETVFANLIERKDNAMFSKFVINWQKKNEDKWEFVFNNMNRWLVTKGMWRNYDLFREVIVEGIYPIHPIATFMLTNLSDYLQNRSSLSLISQYISDISSSELDDEMVLILPERLMVGDLYTEMLSAEQEGKQPSQQCIKYANILSKFMDKLNDKSLAVLRSNLILRLLRFRTIGYEDAKLALSICSGLSIEEITVELNFLENQYAILGFDEHASCFDFMEESHGAHDFKIIKKRLMATTKIENSIFSTAKISDLSGTINQQSTNFGITRKILTNEWNFKQELLSIEEFTDTIAESYLKEWMNAHSSTVPKGRLIWLYMNKNTDVTYLERAQRLVYKYIETPIVVMLLNDNQNRLYNAITEYKALDDLDDTNRKTYSRYYASEFGQAEINLREEFDSLKMKREYILPDSVGFFNSRLAISLTDIFEKIYSEAVPFNFDGLITKGNNIGGKGSVYYCSIIKMLLSNTVNYDNIHNFSNDVRNRIDAVLMITSNTSWKCINTQYEMIPPENEKVRQIYDGIVKTIVDHKTIDCIELFNTYCKPPYGMSEDVVVLMISVICANLNYCLRFKYNDELTSISNWKERVVIKDKKIDLEVVKSSSIVWVDAGAVTGKYIRLFERIENNHKLSEISILESHLEKILEVDELPEELRTRCKLARKVLDDGKKVKNEWTNAIRNVEDKYNESLDNENIYNALEALKALDGISIKMIFDNNNFEFSDEYKNVLNNFRKDITTFIDDNIEKWVSNLYCKNVESITKFGTHISKMEKTLQELGFHEYASLVRVKGDKELSNKENIRSRQQLKEDYRNFIKSSNIDRHMAYVSICKFLEQGKSLQERMNKYELTLGNESDEIIEALMNRIAELSQCEERIKQDMLDIWDDLFDVSSAEDVEDLILRINIVLQKGIPTKDNNDFIELKNNLEVLLVDLESVKAASTNRKKFMILSNEIKNKYKEESFEVDVIPIIDEVCINVIHTLDEQEKLWKERFLSLGDKSRASIHKWKENTKYPPEFLTDETKQAIYKLNQEADKLISEGKIEDVIFYFNNLEHDEKIRCIERLKDFLI